VLFYSCIGHREKLPVFNCPPVRTASCNCFSAEQFIGIGSEADNIATSHSRQRRVANDSRFPVIGLPYHAEKTQRLFDGYSGVTSTKTPSIP
jgi:hypothetical protein